MNSIFKFVLICLISIPVLSSEEVPTKEEVGKLYVATFNRAPDHDGLHYWVETAGLPLSEIARSFFYQNETQLLYPENNTNRDFVKSIYRNLFNREAEQGGLNYWENELNEGRQTRDKFILSVISSAHDSEGGYDKTILNNKNKVGLHFANMNFNDYDNSKRVLANITASNSTVDDSISFINQLVVNNDVDTVIDMLDYIMPKDLVSGSANEFHFDYQILTYYIDQSYNFIFNNLYEFDKNTRFIAYEYLKRVSSNKFDRYRNTNQSTTNMVFEKIASLNVSNTHLTTILGDITDKNNRFIKIGDISTSSRIDTFNNKFHTTCQLLKRVDKLNFYDLEIYDVNENFIQRLGDDFSEVDKVNYPNFTYNDLVLSKCTTLSTEGKVDSITYSYLAKGFGNVLVNTHTPNSKLSTYKPHNYHTVFTNPNSIKLK